MREKFIPLSIPNFEGNEKKYVEEALEQGWVSTGGAFIDKFEQQLSAYLKVERVVACQSGTAGLHLAMVECGIESGDIVIAPTLTFIAAVNPIRYQLADVILMDCDDSLCLDPVKLRWFCENECEVKDERLVYKASGRTIKAVVVVHVFGNLADMEQIMDIAEKFHLCVIEDATEALGSYYSGGRYTGMYAGTIGDFGIYSFNGNKIITTGGGGAITGKNLQGLDHIRYLSTQAKDDGHNYIHNEIGYNYRMTNLQAAVGVAQMEELSVFIERKHRHYECYEKLFADFRYGRLLEFREGTFSNRWFYAVEIFMDQINGSLHDVIFELQKRNIQTRPIWGLIHEQRPYITAVTYQIEKALYYSKCILNIPCSTQITEEEIQYVAEQIKLLLGEMTNG